VVTAAGGAAALSALVEGSVAAVARWVLLGNREHVREACAGKLLAARRRERLDMLRLWEQRKALLSPFMLRQRSAMLLAQRFAWSGAAADWEPDDSMLPPWPPVRPDMKALLSRAELREPVLEALLKSWKATGVALGLALSGQQQPASPPGQPAKAAAAGGGGGGSAAGRK
jgi:hypothetical protein